MLYMSNGLAYFIKIITDSKYMTKVLKMKC